MNDVHIHPIVKIGNNNFIWSGAIISHHVEVGNNCWFTSGSSVAGKTIIEHILYNINDAGYDESIIVLNKENENFFRYLKENNPGLTFAFQKNQLGQKVAQLPSIQLSLSFFQITPRLGPKGTRMRFLGSQEDLKLSQRLFLQSSRQNLTLIQMQGPIYLHMD